MLLACSTLRFNDKKTPFFGEPLDFLMILGKSRVSTSKFLSPNKFATSSKKFGFGPSPCKNLIRNRFSGAQFLINKFLIIIPQCTKDAIFTPIGRQRSELCSILCSGDRFWPFYNFQFFGGREFSLPWKVVVASVGHRTNGKLPLPPGGKGDALNSFQTLTTTHHGKLHS